MTSCYGQGPVQAYTFNKNGHHSGNRYLPAVNKMLKNCNIPFRCDAPTEAYGNCFTYAVMQQLHRPEIHPTLSDEMKLLSENYHYLRTAIVRFVKDITPESEYFTLIDAARTNYAELAMDQADDFLDWDAWLKYLSKDGKWFDDQFMKFTASFLRRDIICYTATCNVYYCGAPTEMTFEGPSDATCNCAGRPLHIANIANAHYQSILPIQTTLQNVDVQNETNAEQEKQIIYHCTQCNYSTQRQSNLKRHAVKHKLSLPNTSESKQHGDKK